MTREVECEASLANVRLDEANEKVDVTPEAGGKRNRAVHPQLSLPALDQIEARISQASLEQAKAGRRAANGGR